jgi:hypothetical protein
MLSLPSLTIGSAAPRGGGCSSEGVQPGLLFAKSPYDKVALDSRQFCSEQPDVPGDVAPVAKQKRVPFVTHDPRPTRPNFQPFGVNWVSPGRKANPVFSAVKTRFSQRRATART